MAAPTPPPRPGRPLAFLALLIVAMYAGAMLIQSTWKPTPQLGLDLRGGTSATLTAQVAEGSGEITSSAMNQAKDIITNRVNGTGVAEAEVIVQGNNIIVNVPGEQFDADLLSTALLRFRQVLQVAPVTPAVQPSPSASPTGPPSPSPSATVSPSPSESASPTESGRAISQSLLGAQDASPSPTGASTPVTPPSSPSPSPSPSPTEEQVPISPEVPAEVQQAFDALTDCSAVAEQRSGEIEPADELLVTCSEDGTAKYILGPVAVDGTNVSGVQAVLPPTSAQWQVDLTFDSEGTDDFAYITEQLFPLPSPTNQLAIVLDGLVVSAPVIQESLPAGQATITGDFTQDEAEELADVLKYGALPLAFVQQELNEISATLGSDYLAVGLTAGIIGLILVVGYSILYYRGLAVVAVSSLAIAAALTYAAVVLLSEWIDFTLTLAGIAGLIVAIGITADSFIVFFERLRDEVRDGRSLRAAVEHGWNRAKRTILVADTVSFLAAAVLYLLAIGNVRGFAFTLGLTTVIDVFVVFLFTKPLMTLLARTKFFGGGHRWSGLDPARLGAKRVVPTGQPQTIVARRRAVGVEES